MKIKSKILCTVMAAMCMSASFVYAEEAMCEGYPVPAITMETEGAMCEGYPVPEVPSDKVISNNDTTFIPLIENEQRGVLAYITVQVSSPCDQYWRQEFPSDWMYMANYVVEEGDNFIAETFNIDYVSVAQREWNNTVTDSYGQYYQVRDNIGKTNGADVMIAFSAKDTDFGGLGHSDGYCLVWYFDYAGIGYSCNTVTHESGHMYGINVDGGCSTACLMSGSANNICNSCYNIWYGNRNKWN